MQIEKNCLQCNKKFLTEPRYINRGHGKFCSVSCSSKFKRKNKKELEPNVFCSYCNKKFYMNNSKKKNSKSGLYFCCRNHKDLAQRIGGVKEIMPRHYGTGSGDYSFAKKNYCEDCGYNKIPQILHVHHIDRDRTNNKVDNLVCICPTCHEERHFLTKSGRFTCKASALPIEL